MFTNKETVVCISLAARPGNLGATLFNHVFERLAMNWLYQPFQVDLEDLPTAIAALRTFHIRGCGVSMPHKVAAMQYLDSTDETARKIGAINTIVNTDGRLAGYNTDYIGAFKLLSAVQGGACILGAGGVARAIIQALKDRGVDNISVTNRDEAKARALAEAFDLHLIPWGDREVVSGVLLVNATPVGMQGEANTLVSDTFLRHFDVIMDVVISAQDTELLARAKRLGKSVLYGRDMATLQAIAQFELYTGQASPVGIFQEGMEKFLKST